VPYSRGSDHRYSGEAIARPPRRGPLLIAHCASARAAAPTAPARPLRQWRGWERLLLPTAQHDDGQAP